MLDREQSNSYSANSWLSELIEFSHKFSRASSSKNGMSVGQTCKSIKPIKFLQELGMEPNPENYQLAWEYSYGANSLFRLAIDAAIEEHGYLTEALAQQISADYLDTWNAAKLAKLISGSNKALRNGDNVIRQNHTDSCDFGDAIQGKLDKIEQSSNKNAYHYTELVKLTKIMAVKSLKAQQQLEDARNTLVWMRTELMDATQKAEIDQLTGLPNRWAFENRLTDASLRAREAMEPLSLAYISVDNLKNIIDNHGHEARDRILVRVAEKLNKLSASNCHVARHGGEKFVILFRNKTTAEVKKIIDRAREKLCSNNFVNRSNGKMFGSIGFSAGVSGLTGDGDTRAMLRRADTALREAKDMGKNRVLVHG